MKNCLIMMTLLFGTMAHAAPCTNSTAVQYKWSWCMPQDDAESPIERVCFGTLTVSFHPHRAVEIKMKSGETQCVFASKESGTVEYPAGCSKSVLRNFLSVENSKQSTPISECIVDGFVVSIAGYSLNGVPFESRPY